MWPLRTLFALVEGLVVHGPCVDLLLNSAAMDRAKFLGTEGLSRRFPTH